MNFNYCPNCGHRTYQHNNNGCTHHEQIRHIIRVQPDGFTVKHPDSEREHNRLFECTVLHQLTGRKPWLKPGDYTAVPTTAGGWNFEPPDQATEHCGCNITHQTLNMGWRG